MEEFKEFPELLPLIMKRAVAAAAGESAPPSAAAGAPGFISSDVLRQMFRRLGLALKALPEKRREDLLGLLAEGVAPPGTDGKRSIPEATLAIARSIAEAYSDREFLELLASLLSLEEKGEKRLLQIFEIIASERDVRGSLLPLLRKWKRENLREKKYFAAKTWETIERLLLDQGRDGVRREGPRRTSGEALHLSGKDSRRRRPLPEIRPPVLRRVDPTKGSGHPGGVAPFGETGRGFPRSPGRAE